MSVSYYDLLDVDRDASTEEIQAAWSAAIAGLSPTDRRFRAYTQAAETLLDPASRTAYDASVRQQDLDAQRVVEESDEPVVADAGGSTAAPVAHASATGRTPPAWLIAAVGALALLLAGAAVWLGLQPTSERVEADASQAQVAAENAVAPVLDYDAADLAASQARAQKHLTAGYGEKYDDVFDGLVEQNAPQLGTKVTTKVIASSVVTSDVDRAEILLFIDQVATSKQDARGKKFNNQVTLTMAKVGDQWLVDGMCTNQDDC